jgi:hypothetical protein
VSITNAETVESGFVSGVYRFIFLTLQLNDECHHSQVAKRMGDSCTQVGEPAVEKTGRPEGLPRTAVIERLCRRASKKPQLAHSQPSGRQT